MPEQTPNNLPSLEDSRGIYIDELDRFRHHLHVKRSGPSDFERLSESSGMYADSFSAYLLDIQKESDQPLGRLTAEEVVLRREQLAKRFKEKPLYTYPDMEVIIGGSAILGAGVGAVEGRISALIGGGLLAVTSYFSFQYKRRLPIIDPSINDRPLISYCLERLSVSETAPHEYCMVLFNETLHSEETSVTKMAMQVLSGRTYTPLGLLRLIRYNIAEKRRSAKAAKKDKTENS